MKRYITKIYDSVVNPPEDAALSKAWQLSANKLPTIWLLGKTGAGKSSIVQKMTGESAATIGNGFMPCTSVAQAYNFPVEQPIMRFMDTRGLGEVEYDPGEDIEALSESSHAILIVMRLRDPEQSAVIDAIRKICKSSAHLRSKDTLVVYTGINEINDERDRRRLIEKKQRLVDKAWGSSLDYCEVDFQESADSGGLTDFGEERLREMLAERLPNISLWLNTCEHDNAEKSNFGRLRSDILWYATVAAASDAAPGVGLVSVPAIQGKMLHSLAGKYGIEWNFTTFSEFVAALGSGFAMSYASSHVARQLIKLIPVYGQVAGTAFSVTVSYGVTYALGRAACMYLYHQKTGTPLDSEGINKSYSEAVAEGKSAGKEIQREHN